MGALLGGSTKTVKAAEQTVQQPIPQPEQTADGAAVGNARKQEDQKVFGADQPDFRIDRPAGVSGSSVGTSGSGLKLM